MEREIVLSSYSVKNKDNNKPENFVTDFVRPIILDSNHEYMIGLNRIINMSFTWFNINAGYNNQLIGYSEDTGSTFINIAFPAGKVSIGPRVPNLSQDTDILNIHCDLVNSSLVDGEESDIIFSFSTSVLRPSYSFTLEPRRITFNPLNKNTISSIRIYITDGKRRVINLNYQDVAFSLILKKFG